MAGETAIDIDQLKCVKQNDNWCDHVKGLLFGGRRLCAQPGMPLPPFHWPGLGPPGPQPAAIINSGEPDTGSDSIPWYRPFFWSPTTECEAAQALKGVLDLIGCPASQKRTVIPYKDDPDPVSIQHILLRARDAGYTGEFEPRPFVVVPGYDAGAGFYFKNIRDIAVLGFDVYGVDLLGHGLSSRPQFRGTSREDGERFYTDALEEWRKAEGLESFVLMGHSFGGYVAGCYALAHQQRVKRLVLVCSAGVEEVNASCFGPNGQPWGLEGIPLEAFKAMWHNINPQTVVRFAGPLGPLIAGDYVQKKFGPKSAGGLLTEKESHVLERYLFHCLAGGGKGAVCNPPPHHSLFFGPGVVAFCPLSSRLYTLDAPVSFVYGVYDWMDWKEADKLRADLRHAATLTLVEDAGHHVYIENPEGFKEALEDQLRAEMRGVNPLAGMRGIPSIRRVWGVARKGYESMAVDAVVDRLIEDTVDVSGGETLEEYRAYHVSPREKHFGIYD